MIYVITNGRYYDYRICAVATTRERAEELQRFYSNRYSEAQIEEFIENAPDIKRVNRQHYYQICFKEDGELNEKLLKEYWERCNLPIQFKSSPVYDEHLIVLNIPADNEETAIKIARERRTKYLIEKYQLN